MRKTKAPAGEAASGVNPPFQTGETQSISNLANAIGPNNAPNGLHNVTHEEIARLAYSFWEARGFQGGSPEEDWYRAEIQLRAAAAGKRAEDTTLAN